MSGLTAWAQCMSPQTAAFGLYWKNMWYRPFQKIGPSGSFIQLRAGSRWNCGRSGSAARRACNSSFVLACAADRKREGNEAAAPAAPSVRKKFRREENIAFQFRNGKSTTTDPNNGSTWFVQCVAQAADDALLAENDHGVKKRRRDGLADNRHANRVDEQARFHAGGFRHGARGVIAGVMVPLVERRESVRGFGEQILNLIRILPEFFLRGGIAREVVAEESARPGGKIRQQADARAKQIDGFREPFAARARGPFVFPEAAALQLRFHFGQQVLDGELLQILRVEPFELGAVEDGVGAAHASSENFWMRSLVRRNSSSPPADQPRSARKLRNASGRKPSARYMLTSVAPWRFERRDLSGPRIRGTCAKIGGSAPSAR